MALSFRATDDPVQQLALDSRVARAFDWISKNLDWITAEHIRITEIPAPEFGEGPRAAYLQKLLEAANLKTRTDDLGDVIAERPGANGKDVVLIVAHLDTVFPAGTDVQVKRNHGRLEGPGISDNAAGLVALVATARALSESRVRTGMTIVFAADVGEEGEGNLRGIRKLVETYRSKLRAVIAIDGASIEHVTTMALASRRIQITVTGPGGHSWSDFGVPNPITALSRAIVRMSSAKLPDNPRTVFNVGMIEGGTSVNSIPHEARIKVDLRSEKESELDSLESALRAAVQKGIEEEMAASHGAGDLDVDFKMLGVRPGGEIASNAPLLEAINNVDRYLGNRTRIERSSTDANIPLSLGIPAIAIGGGGLGGGSHTLDEWYDPTGRELGLKRIILTALTVAGVQP